MKYLEENLLQFASFVAPCAGAGIEIEWHVALECLFSVAPCAGAGIEI